MNEIERQMAIDPEGTVEDLVRIIRRQGKQLQTAVNTLTAINLNARQYRCLECLDSAELAETALKSIREGK